MCPSGRTQQLVNGALAGRLISRGFIKKRNACIMAPKHGTRTAAKASAAAEPMRKLSEVPGVLEEGKIFFLYR